VQRFEGFLELVKWADQASCAENLQRGFFFGGGRGGGL